VTNAATTNTARTAPLIEVRTDLGMPGVHQGWHA
jgi:hypothetical protein